nr:EAL domain-containing protein [Microvirga puerhi]
MDALEEHRIEPFYQPKVCLTSGRISGFEALLRWKDKHGQIRFPADIDAAFGHPDLAVTIGQHMRRLVFANVHDWLSNGIHIGRVAINVATAELQNEGFAVQFLNCLRDAGVSPTNLELEVTETVFLGRGAEYVERALHRLSSAGVAIALDDFGTGYASLSHLNNFPVDSIKIDRSFVQNLSEAPQTAMILQAMLRLGRNLGIATVAEGIETESQAAYLRTHGCDQGQGYLFSAALPAHEIARLCKDWQSKNVLNQLGAQSRAELWASIGAILNLQPVSATGAI